MKIIISFISFFIFILLLHFTHAQDIRIESGTKLNISSDAYLIIPGNWYNYSDNSLTQNGTSLVRFNGNELQTIRSGESNSFNQVEINNSYNSDNYSILLEDDFSVKGELNLVNGIINTNDNTVIFQSSATTNIGSDNSFIDGNVQKNSLSTSFTFPVGNVNERDIGEGNQTYKIWAPFKANPDSETNLTVRYFFSNENLPPWWYHDWTHDSPLTHTTSREYWLVESGSDLSSVTLNWNNNDPCLIHDFCEEGTENFLSQYLAAAYWDGNIWKDAGGTVSGSSTSSEGYISGASIPFGSKNQQFITFGGKDADIPLPVELIYFSAKCDNSRVNLLWQTASETNNEGFIIEKSNDLIVFEEIGFVEGKGFSNTLNTYTFKDKNKSYLNTYYRLKQIDFDGTYEYSNIISINCEFDEDSQEPSFEVFPNPTRNFVNITAENMPHKDISINIYNMLGSLLHSVKIDDDSNRIMEQIDLSNYPPSMYMIRIVSGDYVGVAKVEKQ